MNTIYFLLSLICTRQLFHYIQNEQSNCGNVVRKITTTNITREYHEHREHDVINRFLKFPPRPQFIKNMNIDNGKFLFMLLTVFM